MAWRVLIVDDHAGFRGFARRILEADGLTVVGEAASGRAALAAVEALEPDLVLLDVMLPDLDGFRVADRLAERSQRPLVVLTSSRDAADFDHRLGARPVTGFIQEVDLSAAAILALAGDDR